MQVDHAQGGGCQEESDIGVCNRLIANFKGREDPFENAFDYFDILGSVKACVCSRDGT